MPWGNCGRCAPGGNCPRFCAPGGNCTAGGTCWGFCGFWTPVCGFTVVLPCPLLPPDVVAPPAVPPPLVPLPPLEVCPLACSKANASALLAKTHFLFIKLLFMYITNSETSVGQSGLYSSLRKYRFLRRMP